MDTLEMGREASGLHRNRHTGAYYPWDAWLGRAARKAVTLRRGVDYRCRDHGMANQIRNQAARRDLVVSVAVDEGSVRFSVIGGR